MSKWVDVSSSNDNEEEYEDSKSLIEEDHEDEDNDEAVNSGSDSEEEIYKTVKESKDLNNEEEEKQYALYKPTESEQIDFINQLNIIRDVSDEVNEKIESMINNIDSDKYEVKYGLSFFDAKQNMLIMYLEQLLAYFQLKLTTNESIDNSSLIRTLITTKALIEKSKIIDIKLKPQIDRLLSLAANKGEEEANFKPRILEEAEGGDENEEDEEEEERKEKAKAKAKYEVKKNMIEFFETRNEKKFRIKQIEKDKAKIRHSEIIQSLRDEISDNPRTINTKNSHTEKFMAEVEKIEDETFQRQTFSKKFLKQLKKKDKKEEDLRNFDKDLKQMTNILLHDDLDEREEINRKTQFLQRKREINKIEHQNLNEREGKGNNRGRGGNRGKRDRGHGNFHNKKH